MPWAEQTERNTADITLIRERLAVVEANQAEVRLNIAEMRRVGSETERKVDVTNRKLDEVVSSLHAHIKATEEVIQDNKVNKAVKNRFEGAFKWIGIIGTAFVPLATIYYYYIQSLPQ